MKRDPDNTSSSPHQVRFGAFRFDVATLELWRADASIALGAKPGQILAALLARPGELVTREELYAAGWDDTVVAFDLALNSSIRRIRATLGDRAEDSQYIQTVPRRGYRFVAPVTPVGPNPRPDGHVNLDSGRVHRWTRLVLAACLGGFALAASLILTPSAASPSVEVTPVRLLDSTLDQVTGTVLEETIRNAVVDRGGGQVSVIASTGVSAAPAGRAEYVVRGTLHTTAAGEPRFDVQVVRSSDQTIVWTGKFNPHCSLVSDPTAVIAAYVAKIVVERLT